MFSHSFNKSNVFFSCPGSCIRNLILCPNTRLRISPSFKCFILRVCRLNSSKFFFCNDICRVNVFWWLKTRRFFIFQYLEYIFNWFSRLLFILESKVLTVRSYLLCGPVFHSFRYFSQIFSIHPYSSDEHRFLFLSPTLIILPNLTSNS